MQSILSIGNLVLRRIDPENENDVATVQIVLEKSPRYYQIVEGVNPVPEEMAKLEIEGVPPKQSPTYEKHFLIAYLDKLPIGVVDLHKDHPEKGSGYIGLLLLDEKYQCKGWGSKVYVEVEKYCHNKLQLSKLLLGVAQNNDVSPFWEKLGFRFNGKTYTYTGAYRKVLVGEMEKEFTIELPTGG